MKTRSNMPLFVLECDNVKTLSNSQIDLLRCGDYLVKKDASGEHAYKVTFKSDTGMCLTYHDASVIETQSYDFVDGNWVYNSEDKTPNLLDALVPDDITGGTLENAKPIYWHSITIKRVDEGTLILYADVIIINNDPTPFTMTSFMSWLNNLPDGAQVKIVQGYISQYPTNLVSYISKGSSNVTAVFNTINLSTGVIQSDERTLPEYAEIIDNGVNKIN